MNVFKFITISFIFFLLVYPLKLAANEKITYLDMNYLMSNSLAGKSLYEQLNKNKKNNNEKFKTIEKNLEAEKSKLSSQKNVLDPKEYIKKIEQLKNDISKYQELRKKTIIKNNNDEIKAQSLFFKNLDSILAEYSKTNSISIIMNKKNVVIAKTELDITSDILKILNKKIKSIRLQ